MLVSYTDAGVVRSMGNDYAICAVDFEVKRRCIHSQVQLASVKEALESDDFQQ